MVYIKDVTRVSSALDSLNNVARELIQLVAMMEELRLSNIEKQKIKVKEVVAGVNALRTRVDEANVNYDQNLNKSRKEL